MSDTIPIQIATVLETIKRETDSIMLIDLLSKMIIADNTFNEKMNVMIKEITFLKSQIGDLSERLSKYEFDGDMLQDIEDMDDDDANSDSTDE